MTYLVAADAPGLDARVSPRMGDAPWHLLVDADSGLLLASLDRTQRGECKGFGKYRQYGLAGIIAGNIGPNRFRRAQCHKLPVFIERRASVLDAVQAVASGRCTPVTEPTRAQSRKAAKGDFSCEEHGHGPHHHHDHEDGCGGHGQGRDHGPGHRDGNGNDCCCQHRNDQ